MTKKKKALSSSAPTAPEYLNTELRPHTYTMPQELLTVKDYALTTVGGKRYAVLRWVKHRSIKLDKISFCLYQYDVSGRELDRRDITVFGSELPMSEPEVAFASETGIAVNKRCAELKIQLTEVVSTPYIYSVRNGRASVDYDFAESWSYTDPRAHLSKLDRKFDRSPLKLSVSSKRVFRPRLLWLLAILNVLSMVGSMLMPLMIDIYF